MILYADILFVVDLSMDWLTLALCARLTHRPVSGLRLLLAAMAGALGSVGLVIVQAGWGLTFVVGLWLSAAMTAISFGTFRKNCKRWGTFCRQWLTVWGCGAVTGGVLSVLMSLGEPVYMGTEANDKPGFLPLFLATAAVVYGFLRLLQKKVRTETTEITITWQGKKATFTALVDTGNLLAEPMTGKPVLLVSSAACPLPLPTNETSLAATHGLPIIAKGASGTRLLWGIRPDSLVIDGTVREALVAAEEVPADHYGGYGGTCPGCLTR